MNEKVEGSGGRREEEGKETITTMYDKNADYLILELSNWHRQGPMLAQQSLNLQSPLSSPKYLYF